MESRRFNAISRALASATSRRAAIRGAAAAAVGGRFAAAAAAAAAPSGQNAETGVVDWLAVYGELLSSLSRQDYLPRDGVNVFFSTAELVNSGGLSQEYADRLNELDWLNTLYAQFVSPDPENGSGTGLNGIHVLRLDTFATSGDAKSYLKFTRAGWERNDITLIPSDENGVSGLNLYTLETPLQSNPDIVSSYVNASLLLNKTTVFTYLAIGYDNPIDPGFIIDLTANAKNVTRALTDSPIARFLGYPNSLSKLQIFVPRADGTFFPPEGATGEEIQSQMDFAQDSFYQYTSSFQFNGTSGNQYLSYQTGSEFETADRAHDYFNFFPDYLANSDAQAGNVSRVFERIEPPPSQFPGITSFARDAFVMEFSGDNIFAGNEIVALIDNSVVSSAIFTLFPIDPGLADPREWSRSTSSNAFQRWLDQLLMRGISPTELPQSGVGFMVNPGDFGERL